MWTWDATPGSPVYLIKGSLLTSTNPAPTPWETVDLGPVFQTFVLFSRDQRRVGEIVVRFPKDKRTGPTTGMGVETGVGVH